MYHYSVYGLCLRSAWKIAGLARASESDSSSRDNLTVHFDASLDVENSARWTETYRSGEAGPNNRPVVIVYDSGCRSKSWLRFCDGAAFLVDQAKREIFVSWSNGSSFEDCLVYLTGPVLAFYLVRRGEICLHASCIVNQKGALVVCGEKGAGKSTLAGMMARKGFVPYADDVTLVSHGAHQTPLVVRSGVSQIRLWPESTERIFGSVDRLPRLVRGWEKRAFHPEIGASAAGESSKLKVVVILARSTGEDAGRAVEVLAGSEKLAALLPHIYAPQFFPGSREADRFNLLSSLASSTPIVKVPRSDSLDDLDGLANEVAAIFDAC